MTGRVVAGWGIVDEVGFAVGRNGDRQPGTECRRDGDQPAQRPWRYREFGADAARGKAASGACSASGGCRASPRSCGSAAGLLVLRREMPRQGLAASPDRDAVRRGDRAAAAVSLHWLWPHRDGCQLAIALSVDTGAGPAASASFRPDALSRRRWRAGSIFCRSRLERAPRHCAAIRSRSGSNFATPPRSSRRPPRRPSPSPWTRPSSVAATTANGIWRFASATSRRPTEAGRYSALSRGPIPTSRC